MGLSRRQLFTTLGIVPPPGPRLHKRTIRAWTDLELWRLNRDPHFRSSFWGSAFPVGPGNHCGRFALYSLMNLPDSEPPHPKLVATARAGKDVENQITYRWARAGITVGGSCSLNEDVEPAQLRLQDPEHWLSCAIDSCLDLRPDWPAVCPVDVKSKPDKTINELRVGAASYDPRHRAQVISYVHVCRLNHEAMGWADMGLEPANGGFLYYCSRDNPTNAVEFWIEYDEAEVENALTLLQQWRIGYEKGILPERPKAWRWTEQPCKWCDLKKLCKADVKDGVTDLFLSGVNRYAVGVNPSYDARKVHAQVLRRWQ